MTPAELRELALSFPAAEEGASYGKPSYLVRGKFFTRLREEDGSVVLLEVGFDEREMLMEVDPETFHLTAHYRDYPCVLARIERLEPKALRPFLERRWRKLVTKTMAKAYDAGR